MPSAADSITAAITAAGGAISFERFMGLALYGEGGFYQDGGKAGRRGDFITSPEVGPLFAAVIARYLELNPNGSRNDIAGITNVRGNVVGIMPHPEHAVEKLTGPTTDGLGFFTSLLTSLVNHGKVSA